MIFLKIYVVGPTVGISILAEFKPMGISFYAVVVFDLGKNHLFKSVLGHCVYGKLFHLNLFF